MIELSPMLILSVRLKGSFITLFVNIPYDGLVIRLKVVMMRVGLNGSVFD